MLLRLPLDVIHYMIRDMLDYESKICLNRVLPQHERFSIKMTKSACMEHQVKVSTHTFSSVMNRLATEEGGSMRRAACYAQALELTLMPPSIAYLINRFPQFKAAVRGRAELILRQITLHELPGLSDSMIARLHYAASRALLVTAGG